MVGTGEEGLVVVVVVVGSSDYPSTYLSIYRSLTGFRKCDWIEIIGKKIDSND